MLLVIMQNNHIDILAVNEFKMDDSFSVDEISVVGYHLINSKRS